MLTILKSPIAVFKDSDFASIFGGSDDIEVFGTNHEIDVGRGLIDAEGMELFLGVFLEIWIEVGETTA